MREQSDQNTATQGEANRNSNTHSVQPRWAEKHHNTPGIEADQLQLQKVIRTGECWNVQVWEASSDFSFLSAQISFTSLLCALSETIDISYDTEAENIFIFISFVAVKASSTSLHSFQSHFYHLKSSQRCSPSD